MLDWGARGERPFAIPLPDVQGGPWRFGRRQRLSAITLKTYRPAGRRCRPRSRDFEVGRTRRSVSRGRRYHAPLTSRGGRAGGRWPRPSPGVSRPPGNPIRGPGIPPRPSSRRHRRVPSPCTAGDAPLTGDDTATNRAPASPPGGAASLRHAHRAVVTAFVKWLVPVPPLRPGAAALAGSGFGNERLPAGPEEAVGAGVGADIRGHLPLGRPTGRSSP